MERIRSLLLTIMQSFSGELGHHLDRRLARALLSQFSGREINPDEFRHILDTLEEDGFVEVDKKTKDIRITREGLTILSVGKEDNQARILRSIIISYQEKTDDEKEPFVNEILDTVSKETQYFERRIQDFTEFDNQYGTNGFLGRIKLKRNIDWLTFSSIAYVQEKDFRSKLRYVDKLSKIFEGANCAIKPREESVEVMLFESFDWKEKIHTTGFQLTQERLDITPSNLDEDLTEFLVMDFLKKHAKENIQINVPDPLIFCSQKSLTCGLNNLNGNIELEVRLKMAGSARCVFIMLAYSDNFKHTDEIVEVIQKMPRRFDMNLYMPQEGYNKEEIQQAIEMLLNLSIIEKKEDKYMLTPL